MKVCIKAPMWKHQVDKPEKGEPSVVTLFRCEMREGEGVVLVVG